MRISKSTYSAHTAGYTPWVPVAYDAKTFNVALAVLPSTTASGTLVSAQYTLDDQSYAGVGDHQVLWSQSTTTVTITDSGWTSGGNTSVGHGLVTGDSINIRGTGGVSATSFDGQYQVTVTNETVYTITVTPSQTASGYANVIGARIFTTTGIPASTAVRTATNLTVPCAAVRMAVAALTTGEVDFIVIQGQGL
jgi:hypothetical protein